MKKYFLYFLLLCAPLSTLKAVYDEESNQLGYEIRIIKSLEELHDDNVKVWITYPDGTEPKRITDVEHQGYSSGTRFFIPDDRIENGYDYAPYKSLKLRVHMQDPDIGMMANVFKFYNTPRYRHRSHLIDIKLDRKGLFGLPFVDFAAFPVASPLKEHPMFKFICFQEYFTVNPEAPPYLGAQHQKAFDGSSNIHEDVVRVFLKPRKAVMEDLSGCF